MTKEELQMLTDWLTKNQDHRFNFMEKEAIKMVLRKADTVGDLFQTALKLLKNKSNP